MHSNEEKQITRIKKIIRCIAFLYWYHAYIQSYKESKLKLIIFANGIYEDRIAKRDIISSQSSEGAMNHFKNKLLQNFIVIHCLLKACGKYEKFCKLCRKYEKKMLTMSKMHRNDWKLVASKFNMII